MSQDNFMYEWRKHKEFFDEGKDGSIIIHDDAPSYIKESYQEYDRVMGKVIAFPERKHSTFSLFETFVGGKRNQSNTKKTNHHKTPSMDMHVKAVFDADEKKQVMLEIERNNMDEKKVEKYACMPFWSYDNNGDILGYIVLKKHTKESAEIYTCSVAAKGDFTSVASALLKGCEAWCQRDGIKYIQYKMFDTENNDNVLQTFYHQYGFCDLETVKLLDETKDCLIMVKKL